MACKRNRILELKDYLLSLGISVNIGKNKARGHKGFFMHRFNDFRIDISKDIDESNIQSVVLHEFAHYIHYCYDSSLSSLNFIFHDLTDDIKEELVKITVKEVPKDFATALYSRKQSLENKLKEYVSCMKEYNPDFKLSKKYEYIERKLNYPVKYLLKYDAVKFCGEIYTVDKLKNSDLKEEEKLYIKIKSLQRAIKRVNLKISRLNRYYNNPSELFARFLDSYYTNNEYTKSIAPNACEYIKNSDNPYILKLNYIFL